MEGGLVDRDVHVEPGVLHRIAGEMLHAGHSVALHAPGQRGAHLSDVEWVLAVGLLGASPCRMAQDVDADAAVEIGADGPELAADDVTDPLLEFGVPGRSPGHAHREAGGPVDDHAPRPVGERESVQPDPLDPGRPERALVVPALAQVDEARPEGRVAVQAPQLLVLGHLGHDRRGPDGRIALGGGSVSGHRAIVTGAMAARRLNGEGLRTKPRSVP